MHRDDYPDVAMGPSQIYKLMKEDYSATYCKEPSWAKIIIAILAHGGFRATALFRIGNYCHHRGWRLGAAIMHRLIFHSCQCTISMAAQIGSGFSIRHCGAIVVGGGVKIGRNCDIRQGVTFGGSIGKVKNGQTQPVVGDNVLIGAGAAILGPVTIGSNTIIGANAVVVTDVPVNCVAGGIPARVLRQDGVPVPQPSNSALMREIASLKSRLDQLETRLEHVSD